MALSAFRRPASRPTKTAPKPASKPASSGRHRDGAAGNRPGHGANPAAEDRELSNWLAALAPESDPESTGSGKRFGEAQVYQLRLNLVASEQLKELAAEQGTSPQALAQEWFLERLAFESQVLYDREPQREPQRVEPVTDEFYVDRGQWNQPAHGARRR